MRMLKKSRLQLSEVLCSCRDEPLEKMETLITAPLARIRIKKYVKTVDSEDRETDLDEVYKY